MKGSDVGEQFKFRNLDSLFNSQSDNRTQSRKRATSNAGTTKPKNSTISDEAVRAVKATAASALDLAADIGNGVGQFIGGLFQPGPGTPDKNESLEAWKLTHPKKKKRITPKR